MKHIVSNITIFAVIAVAALAFPLQGAAECPITLTRNSNAVLHIKAPGGIDAKIESSLIKIQGTGAFGEKEWTFSNFNGGMAKISAYYNVENGDTLISQLHAVQRGNNTIWYLVTKEDPTSDTSKWIVAMHTGSEFICYTTKNFESVALRYSDLKGNKINATQVRLPHPGLVYSHMGL